MCYQPLIVPYQRCMYNFFILNRMQFENFRNILYLRSLARLGEHDISVTTDGEVQDIKIIRSVKHPDYDKRDGTSDIAVLYLEHDAQLSRKFQFSY